MQDTEFVFWFNPRAPRAVDVVTRDDRGHLIGRYTRQTLEQLASQYPAPMMHTFDEFDEILSATMRTRPMEISRGEWLDALEILPPLNWRNLGAFECFVCSEAITGRMHRIYVRVRDTYWTFIDDRDLSVQRVMDRIAEAIKCAH